MKKLGLTAVAAVVGAALWWRRNPSACPYNQRFWVEAPHPLITRPRLRAILEPRPGERLLEVGPGTGYYALPVAEWLGPAGTLHVFDIQQAMLDHTLRAAGRRGVVNVVPQCADATALPYEDGRFDGAYLITVIGEIAEAERALREVARVVRPGGRIVVGEMAIDPDWVTPRTLVDLATRAGLRFERRAGPPFAYYARFGV